MIYILSLRFFLLAHFDLCKGKSLRLKKDTQNLMQSVLTFTQTVKRRGAPEASEASDVSDSDRETE